MLSDFTKLDKHVSDEAAESAQKAEGSIRIGNVIRYAIGLGCYWSIYHILSSAQFLEDSFRQDKLITNYIILLGLWFVSCLSMHKLHPNMVKYANYAILVLIFFYNYTWLCGKLSNVTKYLIKAFKYHFGNVFSNIIAFIYDYFLTPAYDGIMLFVNTIGDVVRIIFDFMQRVIRVIGTFLSWIHLILQRFGDWIHPWVTVTMDQLKVIGVAIGEFFMDCYNGIVEVMMQWGNWLYETWKPVSIVINDMVIGIVDVVSYYGTLVKNTMFSVIERISVGCIETMADIMGTLSDWKKLVLVWLDIVVTNVEDYLSGFVVALGDISSAIIADLNWICNDVLYFHVKQSVEYVGDLTEYCWNETVVFVTDCLHLINENIINPLIVVAEYWANVLMETGANWCNVISEYWVGFKGFVLVPMVEVVIEIWDLVKYCATGVIEVIIYWWNEILACVTNFANIICNSVTAMENWLNENVLVVIGDVVSEWVKYCVTSVIEAGESLGNVLQQFTTWVTHIAVVNILIPFLNAIEECWTIFDQYFVAPCSRFGWSIVTVAMDLGIGVWQAGYETINQIVGTLWFYYQIYTAQIYLKSQNFDVSIINRYAYVTYSFEFENLNGYSSEELKFDIVIDNHAYISSFVMNINNTLFYGNTKPKYEAELEYQSAKEKELNTVLISQKYPNIDNIFEIATNIEASGKTQLNITIEQFVEKKFDNYELTIEILNDLLAYNIYSDYKHTDYHIKLYDSGKKILNDSIQFVTTPNNLDIKQSKYNKYKENEYVLKTPYILDNVYKNPTQLVIKYQTDKPTNPSRINTPISNTNNFNQSSSDNSLFLFDENRDTWCHIFSPAAMIATKSDPSDETQKETIGDSFARRVMFVIDKSGSMEGDKWNKTTQATMLTLNNLKNYYDRFGIILFNDNIVKYSDTIEFASNDSKSKSIEFIKSNKPSLTTNMNDALIKAMKMIENDINYYTNNQKKKVRL